jgi:hypothetical protein
MYAGARVHARRDAHLKAAGLAVRGGWQLEDADSAGVGLLQGQLYGDFNRGAADGGAASPPSASAAHHPLKDVADAAWAKVNGWAIPLASG